MNRTALYELHLDETALCQTNHARSSSALDFRFGLQEDVQPPTVLPVDQFAATFNKAFAGAKAETKDLATEVVTAVQAQDYPKAFTQLQYLTSAPGLNKDNEVFWRAGCLR